MEYEQIFRALHLSKVRYLVAGGVAVILHGYVRLTADLDLIVDLEEKNVLRLIRILNDLGYRPKLPVKAEDFADGSKRERWIKEKGMRVFTFFHPQRHFDLIDIFVREPFNFDEIYARKKIFKAAKDVPISVIGLEDLKQMKASAGRPQDLIDLEALNKL